MYKQWYSRDNQSVTNIIVRFGKWMATDNVNQIKDKIYIFPSLSFYFNHSEVGIRFGFLNFELNLWYKNWLKHDGLLRKKAEKEMNKMMKDL